jgi:flagellar hook-associated protein 3 FlgL
MRVTESLKFDTVTAQLSRLRDQYMQTAQQASSGQKLTAPSDDPVAAASAARLQASQTQIDSYRSTIATVRSDAQMAESSLDSAGQLLQQAIEVAMSGANGTVTADQRQDMATSVDQVVAQMIAIGNTKGAHGYLFGGTQLSSAPFDADGNFSGNDGTHSVSVDNGQPMVVNASGARAFTSVGGRDIIQDLKDLSTALTNNDADSVRSSLDALQSGHSQVVTERARAGVVMDRLDLSDSFLQQQQVDLASRQSTLTSADPSEVFSRLTQLQGALQQTVAVDQQLLQTATLSVQR